MNEELNEGWQCEKHPGKRVYHYIVDSFSLCGKLGLYLGEIQPAKEGQQKSGEDCAACYRKLQIRLKKKPHRTA